jgi:hypothetical protein
MLRHIRNPRENEILARLRSTVEENKPSGKDADETDPYANDPFFKIIFDGQWNASVGRQGHEENYIDRALCGSHPVPPPSSARLLSARCRRADASSIFVAKSYVVLLTAGHLASPSPGSVGIVDDELEMISRRYGPERSPRRDIV